MRAMQLFDENMMSLPFAFFELFDIISIDPSQGRLTNSKFDYIDFECLFFFMHLFVFSLKAHRHIGLLS